MDYEPRQDEPRRFLEARASLSSVSDDPCVLLQPLDPPRRLAPFAVAYSADVTLSTLSDQEEPLGTGRFVLLHSPQRVDAWDGDFRVICFAKAALESDLGLDPFLSDVAWSWLVDSLASVQAPHRELAGTVTKTINTGYGELATHEEGMEIEVRASWTPESSDAGSHLVAWRRFLRQLSGHPEGLDGVVSFDARLHGESQADHGH